MCSSYARLKLDSRYPILSLLLPAVLVYHRCWVFAATGQQGALLLSLSAVNSQLTSPATLTGSEYSCGGEARSEWNGVERGQTVGRGRPRKGGGKDVIGLGS